MFRPRSHEVSRDLHLYTSQLLLAELYSRTFFNNIMCQFSELRKKNQAEAIGFELVQKGPTP